MMEQRSQMLRQMRLTKTERDREVNGCPAWFRLGTWSDHTFEDTVPWWRYQDNSFDQA